MATHPTSFEDWQSYPSSLDPIHLAWLKKAKKIVLVSDQK
jgi:hypothetical protein|tara:strand:+ start:865 stop:984 length:120 start_codon:yes stop_codon:yes gene_type:complete